MTCSTCTQRAALEGGHLCAQCLERCQRGARIGFRGRKRKSLSDQQHLEEHGWRKVATRANGIGRTTYWTHANHQPDRHGFFTTTDAVEHQRRIDQGHGCDCIKEEALHA